MKQAYILPIISGILFSLATSPSLAQRTVHDSPINPIALGVRASPDGGGITAKFFLATNFALEAQVSASEGYYRQPDDGPNYGPGWAATALGEYHIIFRKPSWRVFFGGGIHAGKWDKYNHADYDYAARPFGIFGLDAIAGGEYIFQSVPIGISADIKPAVNLGRDASFFPNNMVGVSARYYFGRRVIIVAK